MTVRLAPDTPRPCNHDDCDVAIILAHPPGQPLVWRPYEAMPLDPIAGDVAMAHVLIGNQARRRREFLEHLAVDGRNPVGFDRARELLADYPHHRRHVHEHDTEETPS